MPYSCIDGLCTFKMSLFQKMTCRFDITPLSPNLSRFCVCIDMDDSKPGNLEGEHIRCQEIL